MQGARGGAQGDAHSAFGRAGGAALADPAAQQVLDARGVGGDRRVGVVEGVVVTGREVVVGAGGTVVGGRVRGLVGVAGVARGAPLLARYGLDGARALVGGDALGGLAAVGAGAFVHGEVPRIVVGDEPVGPGWCGPPP